MLEKATIIVTGGTVDVEHITACCERTLSLTTSSSPNIGANSDWSLQLPSSNGV
jgi:hypothetical protein